MTFTAILLCNSCSKSPDCLGVFIDYNLYLKVQNQAGDNLLDEGHADYVNVDTVSLYRIAPDGCEVMLENASGEQSANKGFEVVKRDGHSVLKLALDGYGIQPFHHHGKAEIDDSEAFIPEKIEQCTLLIKWNRQNTNTDTISSTFVHLKSTKEKALPSGNCSMHYYDKVYCNGKQIVTSYEGNKNSDCPILVK